MPTHDRVLVYKRKGSGTREAIKSYIAQGYTLNVDLFTRCEPCYKGPERCARIWTESEAIAEDYSLLGIPNDLGR